MLQRIALIFLICFFGFELYAQEEDVPDYSNLPVMDYSNVQEYVIGGVNVTGVKIVDAKVLASMSGLNVGSRISIPGDEITRVMEKFWDQGLFSDVKVIVAKIEGNLAFFEIILRERPRLSTFSIEGVKKSELKDLNEKLGIRAGGQVTENALNNYRTIISKFFREKGFYNISTQFIVKDDPGFANRVTLKILIDKGEKVKISEIDFIGNQEFRDWKLRRVMKKTKQKKWNPNFFKSKKFIESEFKEDRTKLAEFYNKNGYRDFKIDNDSITFIKSNRIILHIRVSEGEKYYYRNITWVGNTKYSTDALQRALRYNKGDVYDQYGLAKRLNQDDDAVSTLYTDYGYLFSNITPVELRIDKDSVDIEMRVYEGEQATIDRIIIKGNLKTNEHVARRELRTLPGDLFSRAYLMRDVRELATMGHFNPEKLQPDIQPNPQNATVDIIFPLEEKANDQLELSAGFGGGMFIGRVGVRFNNFAASRMLDPKAWRPVPSGDGQTLGLSLQSNGRYYQAYNITFVEPWLGGKRRNALSVSLYHSKMTNRSYYWDTGSGANQYYKSSGITVGLGRYLKWPDDYFALSTDVSYMRYKVNDWDGRGYYSLPFRTGASNNINFGITLARSSQDQNIFPKSGSNISLSLNITPPWSLFNGVDYKTAKVSEKYKWIEYHKWKFKAAWYLNVIDKIVVATNYQFGYLGYFNKDVGFSPYEGFDMGGSGMQTYQMYGIDIVSMRGYNDGALTPRVRSGDNYYNKANIYTKANIEVRYPVMNQTMSVIYVLGFIEAGNAWYEFKDYNPFNLKRTAGFGIRAFLPMFGMLGLDWGFGFDPAPGSKQQFQFILGQQF